MATGLFALLDKITAIAQVAAASLDDTAAAAGKASIKAAGVVIDDTAVTPRYVHGFEPARELPIVGKIALGSLRNKLLFLLPGALALSFFAPWAITPLLMAGGAFLCYEGAEKLYEVFWPHPVAADDPVDEDPVALEQSMVSGAIRTDLILSGEIMAISLASVSDRPLMIQAASLALVAVLITVGVYGVVGLIVKMDDIGLHMAKQRGRLTQKVGRGMVKAMPLVLNALEVIGTAAMLWVGGGIIVHGLEHFHLTPIPTWAEAASHWAGALPGIGGVAGWIAFAMASALVGLAVGGVIAGAIHLAPRRKAP